MLYFDTSFLAPLVLPEAASETVAEVVMTLQEDELAVSHWTRVEFASLLARKVRTRELEIAEAHEVRAHFEQIVEKSFTVLLPNRDDYDQARNWLSQFNTSLKAADALHLAIAMNCSANMVYSLDKLMIKAGKTLGLPVTGVATGF